MFFAKVILILVLFSILVQDYKERKVYWFLYPIVGILVFTLQYFKSGFTISLVNSLINSAFVSILILTGYVYNFIKLKLNFLEEVFGIGDLLFFIFISFSFSTISFIILFVFSLLFALLLHQFLKNKSSHNSIPLAGYMSLFFGVTYLLSFVVNVSFLYAI